MEIVLTVIKYAFFIIIGFSILVFVHEFGHFVFARLCGIGVEVFAIGWGKAIFSFKKKGVEYKLGIFPIGGYCKMKGQDDFGDIQTQGDPDEFYQRPAWARFLAVFAGPLFSYLFGFLIFFLLIFFSSEKVYVGNKIAVSHFEQNSTNIDSPYFSFSIPNQYLDSSDKTKPSIKNYLEDNSFKNNDQIISIQAAEIIEDKNTGKTKEIKHPEVKVNDWQEIIDNLSIKNVDKDVLYIKVKRTENNKTVYKTIRKRIGPKELVSVEYPIYNFIKDFSDSSFPSPAKEAGLQKGDIILAINNLEIQSRLDLPYIIQQNKDKPMNVKIKRGEKILNYKVTPRKNEKLNKYMIGIVSDFEPRNYKIQSYNILESAVKSFEKCNELIVLTIKGLGMLITGKVAVRESVGGPVMIFGMVGKVFVEGGIIQGLNFIAMISVLLGFFNLLPIPAVDGGHILLTFVEIIRRKRFSIETLRRVQIIGFALLITIAILATINDITNLGRIFGK